MSRAHELLIRYKRVWEGSEPASQTWLDRGIAIEGDFSGIQAYVLRPVPGVRGAAKRLRARSFRVANLTAELASEVGQAFGATEAFYVAGGRFLVSAPPRHDWQTTLAVLQRQIDLRMHAEFDGDAAFHLAAAPYTGQSIPRAALFDALCARKARPLEYSLIADGSWSSQRFFAPASISIPASAPAPGRGRVRGWGKCPACLRTMPEFRRLPEDQEICLDCNADVELGSHLSRWQFPGGWQPAAKRTEVVHHFPQVDGEPATFEDLAALASGKAWLGHLRIDGDRIGTVFGTLNDNASRIWGLSHFLHTFFSRRLQELISEEYPSIYPVYGGGDDLYVIGPWDTTLRLARRLTEEFLGLTKDLTFSAGFTLGKPHQHILTKSDEAKEALDRSKELGRQRITALGATHTWQNFRNVLRKAADVYRWYKRNSPPLAFEDGQGGHSASRPQPPITSAFLQDILQLSCAGGDIEHGLWRPLLQYQADRNVGGGDEYCDKWIRSLLAGGIDWELAPTVVRWVLLASSSEKSDAATS